MNAQTPVVTVFEEATPLIQKIGDMMIGNRLPVVLYAAAVLIDSCLNENPPGGPAILERLHADVREMIAWMVQSEAARIAGAGARVQ